MFGSDYSLWITLKLPWAKSCGSPVELQRMRKQKRQHSAKSGKMVSNFKLQSCKASSVLNPTTAYIRQIAHWSIIRTSRVFILCLFLVILSVFYYCILSRLLPSLSLLRSLSLLQAKRTGRWQNWTFIFIGL